MIGKTIARYTILDKLGEGGMGTVYKARDTRLDRLVALKVLHAQESDVEEQIRRFAQEAKAASALNHPNIVTIYEIDRMAGGADFIAMEFVEGRTLRSFAGTPMPVEMLTSVGRQAGEALAAAHAQGIIHRDIKPENIMIRHDGYIKILDFGLARLLFEIAGDNRTRSFATAPNVLVGTLAYMSPEQARGRLLDGASDIFSLGLVLYELAVGQHAFPSRSQVAVLEAILNEAPVPASRLRPEIPAMLEELLRRMLDKNPAARPSAEEVSHRLGELSAPGPAAPSKPVPPAKQHTVGHERERAGLWTAMEETEAGSGIFLCITGEPGIGKTTLIHEFLDDCSTRDVCIGRGRCSERLAGAEAYLPILEALESLLQSDRGRQWGRLLMQLAPTWYIQIAPSSSGSSERVLAEAKGASQERMKREITLFFQEVTRVLPLILFVDDIHWADVSTVDVLTYLGDRCRSMRLLLITAYRPADLLVTKHPFHQAKLELQARGACRQIEVDFLSTPEIERYLTHSFPGHRFPPEFAALIHARTEGNPLFIVDLLHYMRDKGVIAEGEAGAGWSLSLSMQNIAGGIPESVRSMIERKIERLQEEERRLLVCASVQGCEFDTAVLAEVLQMDAAEIEERLEHLEKVHNFVRQLRETTLPDGTFSIRCQFIHVLYQNALYDSLRPTRRAALSGSVAEALLRLHGEKSTGVAGEMAFLFEAARNPARAIDFYILASQQAARVSANQEAVILARRGLDLLRLLPETPERARRELPLQLAFAVPLMAFKGYTHPELEPAYRRALELCSHSADSVETFSALTGIGAFSFFRPDLHTSLEVIHRLLPMGDSAPGSTMQAWVHFIAGAVFSHAGQVEEALAQFKSVGAAYDPADRLAFIMSFGLDPGVAAEVQQGRVSWQLGLPDSAWRFCEAAVAHARQSAHPFSLAFTLTLAAITAQYRRDPAACHELAAEAEVLAVEYGFPIPQSWAEALDGWALAGLGRAEEGIARLRTGLGRLRAIGAELFGPEFKGFLAELQAAAGDVDGGLRTIEEGLGAIAVSGENFCEAELHRLRGDLLMRKGAENAAAAEEALNRALELAGAQKTLSFELRAASSLCRLLMDRGRAAEGRRRLAAAYSRFTEGFDTPDLREAARLLDRIPPEDC